MDLPLQNVETNLVLVMARVVFLVRPAINVAMVQTGGIRKPHKLVVPNLAGVTDGLALKVQHVTNVATNLLIGGDLPLRNVEKSLAGAAARSA